MKRIFVEVYEAFVPHLPQLFGERRTVEVEVVRHLLPVERDLDGGAAAPNGKHGEIGEEAAPNRLRGRAENPARQHEILLRGDLHHVAKKLEIPRLAHIPLIEKHIHVEEENPALLRGNGVHHHRLVADGVGLREDVPPRHIAENAAIPPQVDILDADAAALDDADFANRIPGVENNIFPLIRHLARSGDPNHLFQLTRRHVPENRRI